MAAFKRSLRWRPPDLGRLTFSELRRLDLTPHCWIDGLDLDAEGRFAGVCVSWASSLGPEFREQIVAGIDRWWRSLSRVRAERPSATILAFRRPDEGKG
ncbi:MAG: hypothetical protein IPJ34_04145 [Myxococcales bacterium]|nr:hypothetical protein [Myxococcales bacterium]